MLAALTEFYRQMGIYSCEFHCKHFDSCKKAAEKAICREKQKWEERREALRKAEEASDDEREKLAEEKKTLSRHGRFTQVGSTYVGTEYDKSGCRLLFLSLDPGSDDPSDDALPDKFPGLRDSQDDPCRRTPEGMREGVIKGLKPNGVKRKWVHWYGTHYLAARILQKAANYPANETSGRVCKVLDGKADRKEKEKKLPCVTPYFAHANVVKCSIGRLGNLQAPDQMYENCHEYLKGELPLLRTRYHRDPGEKGRGGARQTLPSRPPRCWLQRPASVPHPPGVGGRSLDSDLSPTVRALLDRGQEQGRRALGSVCRRRGKVHGWEAQTPVSLRRTVCRRTLGHWQESSVDAGAILPV